jgi:PIN domain nuclease of toxin-antitoxin system
VNNVLDASAILALVLQEPGADRVNDAIDDGAVMLSVNVAEVVTKLHDQGMSEARIRAILSTIRAQVVPFDEELAYRAGLLRSATRAAGLSLGDRACLALAERLGAPALTSDRAWGRLQIGIQIEVLR